MPHYKYIVISFLLALCVNAQGQQKSSAITLPSWFIDAPWDTYVGISMPHGHLDQAVQMALLQYFISTDQPCSASYQLASMRDDVSAISEEKKMLSSEWTVSYTVVAQEELPGGEVVCAIKVGSGKPITMMCVWHSMTYNRTAPRNMIQKMAVRLAAEHESNASMADISFKAHLDTTKWMTRFQSSQYRLYSEGWSKPVEYQTPSAFCDQPKMASYSASRDSTDCLYTSLLKCYDGILQLTFTERNQDNQTYMYDYREATPVRHIRVTKGCLVQIYYNR